MRSSRAIGAEASLIVVDVHQDEAVAIAMAYANFAARILFELLDIAIFRVITQFTRQSTLISGQRSVIMGLGLSKTPYCELLPQSPTEHLKSQNCAKIEAGLL